MWKKIEWEGSLKYEQDFPKKLYRYRTINLNNLDRLLDFELCNESIFLAGLDDMNDRNEGRFLIEFVKDKMKIRKFWFLTLKEEFERKNGLKTGTLPVQIFENNKNFLQEVESYTNKVIARHYTPDDYTHKIIDETIKKVCRIACFTEDPINTPMWAHYAKLIDKNGRILDNAGICIEYGIDKGFQSLNLFPVTYTNEIPKILIAENFENPFPKVFYTKDKQWEYEKEWRISSIINAFPPFLDNLTTNSKIKIENSISSIIFGEATPQEVIELFINRLSKKDFHIQFKRVEKSYQNQTLIITKIDGT